MPVSPEQGWDLAQPVVEVYAAAERLLLARIARQLGVGLDAPEWAEKRLLEVQLLQRRTARDLLAALTQGPSLAAAAVQQAWNRGDASANLDLARAVLPGLRRAVAIEPILLAITQEVTTSLQAVTQRVLRAVPDVYRAVIRAAAPQVLVGTQTRRQAAQAALDDLASRGVSGFTDARGRQWQLDSYVEMATRAATGRAAVDGHVARLAARGFELVTISDAPQECVLCRPWEGKVLTTGLVVQAPAVATLDHARSAGLFHPGAILGDAWLQSIGHVENMARGWYVGPSVNLTTARGYHLTVSPNHPMLTTTGWRRADDLHEGDQVLTGRVGQRIHDAAVPEVQFYDPPSFAEQMFDALDATGYRLSTSAAADDFHGDGRHYEGEVHVVWPDRVLRQVAESVLREQFPDGRLVEAGSLLRALAPGGLVALLLDGRADHVGRPLPDRDATPDEAAPQGRVADAEDGCKLLAGLAGLVQPDQLVRVERSTFTGHAWDLQTESAAYLANGIVAHNCRHSTGIYLPGITRLPTDTADPQGDRDRQRLRALERYVRAAKRREAVALDPAARLKARQDVRRWQAAIREHVTTTSAKRQPAREQIGVAH